MAQTYSAQLAMDAAVAWAPLGSAANPQLYMGCLSWLTPSSAGPVACGVWCYDASGGNVPGSVYVNRGMNCISPIAFGSISTWQ